MIKYINIFVISIVVFFLFIDCDGGLEPPSDEIKSIKSYIRGYVHFEDDGETWPSIDSINDLRVVVFKNYPPGNILVEVSEKNAIFSEGLNSFVDSAFFQIEIKEPPVEWKYIVVAQQYETNLMSWRAIGVYNLDGDHEEPAPLFVEQDTSYSISINVDFNNLPPQPF